MDTILFKYDAEFPPLLKHIPDPPEKLFVRAKKESVMQKLLDKEMKILCVVGARKYSSYGKEAVEKLVASLRGYNICIVSGLALGIDSIAHRAALEAELPTIAFPGSGLDPKVLYPSAHLRLAEEIVAAGGALLSELDPMTVSAPWTFPQRNRLLAGISHATLVVEAELQSGTLITSKYALDYNRDVAALPGQIFSPLSAGPHMLMRSGATPMTCADDLLEFLGYARHDTGGQGKLGLDHDRYKLLSENERRIIQLLQREPQSKDALGHALGINAQSANLLISSLEIEGLIREENGRMRIA